MVMQARYANALYQRPWMPNVGAYPGAQNGGGNALTDAAQAAPIYAGSAPAAVPNPLPNMNGAGEGGAGGMGQFGGYGTSPSFGSWAGNILAGLGMVTGPVGAALAAGRIGGTMIANPNRSHVFGITDFFGTPASAPFGGMSNADIAGMPTQGFADATGLGAATPNGLANAVAETIGSVESSGGDFGAAGQPGSDGFGGNSQAWMSGGYTGDGAVTEPAGIVHRREYVMPADATDHYGRNLLAELRAKRVPRDKLAKVARR